MPDTVLALVPRSQLSVLLTAFHRGGYGHVIRVIDSERAPVAAQLERAGISGARLAANSTGDTVVVLIPAPMRTSQAAALAVANGASDVVLATRGVAVSDTVIPRLITRAGDRRDRRVSKRPPAPPLTNEQADLAAD